MRRLIALGVGVLLLILVLLGVRGCLDARKERSFDYYLRDLSAIVANTGQLSNALFVEQLGPNSELSEVQFQAAIGADRGTADDLLRRVEGLDTPDQLAAAQDDLVLAYGLRADAMSGIAEQIPNALGDDPQDALTALAADMRSLLASDVLYARAKADLEATLEAEDYTPEEPVPDSVFLPEPVDVWIDDLALGGVLAKVAENTGAAPGGLHGTELVSTIIKPGNVQLLPDQENTVSAGGEIELEVSVLNGGESDEADVTVSYVLSGGGLPIEGQASIPRIGAGNTEPVALAIQGELAKDTPLTLTVTVQPVPGELLLENNESLYTVVFN